MSPDDYAAEFSYDLHLHAISGERAAQTDAGQIGASDFTCRQRMALIMARVPASDSPSKWSAFVGSALDRQITEARQAAHPNLLFQQRLTCTLPSGFTLPVTPDEIDPDEPAVTDFKSKAGLAHVRRTVSDDPARIQRHLQYLACLQNGIFTTDTGLVRNVYVDRSGSDDRPHVEQEPFELAIVALADQFVQDAVYAAEHGEDAWRDQPRPWCQRFCPWFTHCRGEDRTDAANAILDPHVAQAATQYLAAQEQEREAKQLRDALRPMLTGVSGTTRDGVRVGWLHVNHPRTPYDKLEVSRVVG